MIPTPEAKSRSWGDVWDEVIETVRECWGDVIITWKEVAVDAESRQVEYTRQEADKISLWSLFRRILAYSSGEVENTSLSVFSDSISQGVADHLGMTTIDWRLCMGRLSLLPMEEVLEALHKGKRVMDVVLRLSKDRVEEIRAILREREEDRPLPPLRRRGPEIMPRLEEWSPPAIFETPFYEEER